MIRVLEVFHGMDCGGAENMIMNLYRKIDRNKVQFDFLVHTNKKCFFDDEIEQLGGKIYRVPYFNLLNTIEYKKALDNFFLNHSEIKLVHGHLGSSAHIYLSIAKKYGCFTIAHSHNTKPEISTKNILYRLFTFQTRYIADYFIGCGREAGEYRFGKKITSDLSRFYILNNAINTNKYIFNQQVRKSVREEFNLKDEILLGHVGRFNYQKNHSYLLDILAILVHEKKNVKLLLVGDGNLRADIEEKAKKMGIMNHIIMTGVRRDVPRLLQGMDCFVFPSHYEGLPVTIIEAQAADLPCVISDNITEEVCITNLITYASLNSRPENWAMEINKLVVNKKRHNRKKDIIDAGYDIDTTAKWLEEFYIKNIKH